MAKKSSENAFVRNIKWIIFLSILGLIVSIYLTITHYNTEPDPFCEALGGGCEIVSKGPWSEIDGILMEQFNIFIDFPLPVSVVGLLGFIFTILVSILLLKKKEFKLSKYNINKSFMIKTLFWANLVGLIFALYLTYIEFILLDTFCVYCDISKILFTGAFIICWMNLKYAK
jgi:uncharacterized membrane protein